MYHRNPRKESGWIQQCHDCFKTWPAPAPDVFQTELMKCVVCGKELQAHPDIESQWTCFEVNSDSRYYCCPDCLQNNADSLQSRYELVLRKITELRGES